MPDEGGGGVPGLGPPAQSATGEGQWRHAAICCIAALPVVAASVRGGGRCRAARSAHEHK